MFYKCASNVQWKSTQFLSGFLFVGLERKNNLQRVAGTKGVTQGPHSEMPWLLTLRTRNLRERCPEAGHLCPIWDELANEKAPWGDEVAGWQRAQVGQWVVGGEHYGGLLGPLGTNRPPGNCWGLQSCQSTNSHLNTSSFPPAYFYPLTIFYWVGKTKSDAQMNTFFLSQIAVCSWKDGPEDWTISKMSQYLRMLFAPNKIYCAPVRSDREYEFRM